MLNYIHEFRSEITIESKAATLDNEKVWIHMDHEFHMERRDDWWIHHIMSSYMNWNEQKIHMHEFICEFIAHL